jgi:hypothetical protein
LRHRSADTVTADEFGECVSCQPVWHPERIGETSANEPEPRADDRDGARKPTAEGEAGSVFDRGMGLAPEMSPTVE